jgi:NADPH-dependent glutamate synthase beta subunit-like oxidoreductase
MGDYKYKTSIPDVEFWKGMVPCQAACPVNTDAGRYAQLIAQGRYEDAYLVARSPNPLASVCGRICAAPCEDRCRRGKIDHPVSIRALKRFVTESRSSAYRAPSLTKRSPRSNNSASRLAITRRSPQSSA